MCNQLRAIHATGRIFVNGAGERVLDFLKAHFVSLVCRDAKLRPSHSECTIFHRIVWGVAGDLLYTRSWRNLLGE